MATTISPPIQWCEHQQQGIPCVGIDPAKDMTPSVRVFVKSPDIATCMSNIKRLEEERERLQSIVQDEEILMAAAIRTARKAKGMTQGELARQLDVSLTFVNQIEKGVSFVPRSRFNQILEVLR